MAQWGSSWWSEILILVLVAVMVVPTGALSSRSNTKALKATPYQTGYGAHETANGPSAVTPSTSGPGNVTWTLCLLNNHLWPGNNPSACGNGITPAHAAFDSANGDVYVTNQVPSNNVSVVSGTTNKVVATIPVGINPDVAAYDSANGDVYVANQGSNNVSVVSGATNKVVATIPVGNDPQGVAYDSANGDIYIVNLISNNVSVVSGATNKVVATIPLGPTPGGGVAYDSANGDIYIDNNNFNNVSVVSGATNKVVATNITVGYNPMGEAYDSANGDIYVTDWSSGSLSVITTGPAPTTYAVNFSESGLAAGTNWSVTLAGNTLSSITGTITFNELNGTYSFTVGTVTGYTSSPSSGNVTVNGASKTIVIAFAKVSTGATYTVTFTESGLPSGTSWSVILNASTKSSTTTTITFQEANGNYSFSVGTVSGYTVSPSSGTVKVNGGSFGQSVIFTKSKQTTGFLGLPGFDGYVLIGVVVAAVAAGALLMLMRKRSPSKPTSTAPKESEEEKSHEKAVGKEEPSPESEKKE